MKVSVRHWRYETGGPESVSGHLLKLYPAGFREGPKQGWYCWVYPDNDREFEVWMKMHCPTAICTHRFNSGDPMYTVHISDEQEATIFKLQWV